MTNLKGPNPKKKFLNFDTVYLQKYSDLEVEYRTQDGSLCILGNIRNSYPNMVEKKNRSENGKINCLKSQTLDKYSLLTQERARMPLVICLNP